MFLLALLLAVAPQFDECDGQFIAAIGADAYQFSPALPGDLGRVRLFSILSHQRAAAQKDWGRALWKLEIRDAAGRLVQVQDGLARIDDNRGKALVEAFWNGRDRAGRPVAPGTYDYTFRGRFLPDRAAPIAGARHYDEVAGLPAIEEAMASTRQVIVDPSLSAAFSASIRASLAGVACQRQQNAPLETGFPYNFYYGSTHSHSNWSDGGQSTSSCSSGNAYGSGVDDPQALYSFARNTAGLDYWVVNEHNHLIDDAVGNNLPPVTEAKVRQRYHDGLAAAQAANVDGAFVAIYGMEWGVLTNPDQGHVTLLETPQLFGWEVCSTCTNQAPECTAGSNCYFDVFTPKRFNYLTMYRRSVENPSPAGALGILAHPSSGQFDNLAFDANADQALQGVAVRSGLAFNTSTDCADANVGATDYSSQWKKALNLGFHVGPTADHDAHCSNYGAAIPNRTVYVAPALTKAAILQAHKARHFFASEDSNAQLVFATSDGAHILGDIFTAAGGVTLRAAAYDPDGESLSSLQIWRGQIGGGVPSSAYATFTNQDSASITETLTSGTYYYYVHAVQADGHEIWSSPMWITYTPGGGTNNPPSIVTAASASPNPADGTSASVSVLADDDGGEAALTYTWSAAGVTFSPNGVNASKNSTAVFSAAGATTLTVTARDAGGLAATSAVDVTVQQTASGVSVSPASARLNPGASQQFSAAAVDQFGAPMGAQPAFAWSASGGGSVDGSGLFTAGPDGGGPFSVTATAGSASGSASVTVNSAPTVASPASAVPGTTTAALSVLGADDMGESALTYTWSGNAVFSSNGTNAAKNTIATFAATGSYDLAVTIADAEGLTAASAVTAVIAPAVASIAVTPASARVARGGVQQFSAAAVDQYGAPMSAAFAWSVSGGGTIDQGGLFRAGSKRGTFTVTASAGGKAGHATVQVK